MNQKQLLYFLIALTTTFVLINSCNTTVKEDGSLDEVISYFPQDEYFKASLKSLHFVMETQSIENVDKMFSTIIDKYKLPVDSKGIMDGTYTGESPFDAYDYKHVVTITVKNQTIEEIHYNEVHKNGTDKRNDRQYNKKMSITGTSPSVAYPNMEKQMLDKQNIMDIDATSGASYSLYRFRYAVTLALMKAIIEGNSKS